MKNYWLIAGIALLLTGCRPSSPQLHYQSLSVTPVSFQEIKTTLTGTISNDNMFPLSGAIDYAVKINGKSIFTGKSKEFSVGSQATAPFTLETTLNFPQAFGSIKDMLSEIAKGANEIPVSFEGEFATSIVGISLKAPLKAESNVPLPKLPRISLTNIAVKSLSLTQAKLSISAQVVNKNDVAINLQKFAYQLMGKDKEIISSSFSGNVNVAPNSSENIEWDVAIDLKAIDGSLIKRLLDGSLQADLKQGIEDVK